MIVTTLSPYELKVHQIEQYKKRIAETVDPGCKAWLKNELKRIDGTVNNISANRDNAALSRHFFNHNAKIK